MGERRLPLSPAHRLRPSIGRVGRPGAEQTRSACRSQPRRAARACARSAARRAFSFISPITQSDGGDRCSTKPAFGPAQRDRSAKTTVGEWTRCFVDPGTRSLGGCVMPDLTHHMRHPWGRPQRVRWGCLSTPAACRTCYPDRESGMDLLPGLRPHGIRAPGRACRAAIGIQPGLATCRTWSGCRLRTRSRCSPAGRWLRSRTR